MNFLKMISLGVALVFLAACKTVTIENGKIPDEYVGIAKKYEGQFKGAFNGRKGTLSFELRGTLAVLSFANAGSNDLLGADCHSQIQELSSLYVGGSNDNPELRSAVFKFDPGNCDYSVRGREIEVSSDGDGVLRISLLQDRTWERVCRWEVGDPRYGGHEVCQMEERTRYLYGKFERQ